MALGFVSRLRRPRLSIVLNAVIVALLVVNGVVAWAVLGRQADTEAAEPPAAPPVTEAPAPDGDEAETGPEDEATGPSRVTFEELQSSLVVAQALELQIDEPVTASELVAAMPGLTFVNGFTAAGQGVIGIASTGAGILLLTQDGDGMWACAASNAQGESVLGAASDRDAVDSVPGCAANPR